MNTEWFKKHIDTMVILSGILASVLWMNTKFNSMDKDITIIKTVLIMRNILPVELASSEKIKMNEV